jgi:predicted ribosomally synthesized peptide with SipW-like signal peptide
MAMILCFAMFVGTTYAWFTDSVTSTGNKVVAGTLKVDLELKSHEDDTYSSIKDTQAPIFYYDNWEPGYIDSQILKIENEGSLALKWYAKFVSDYELSALANVIDVYVYESATDFAFPGRDLAGYTKVGTVKEFVNTIETTTKGTLAPKTANYTDLTDTSVYAGMPSEMYLGIALKMQETAGNEYQGMSLCGDFDILILATQETAEIDTIDNQYDAGAEFDEFEVRNVSTEAQLAEVISSTTKEAPVVINLKETVTLNSNINVVGDVTINLADNNMDATLNAARPFVMTENSSLTINNMANEDDIVVGAYGLVNVPENVTNVDVTLNGGSYVANTDNGAFLKLRAGYDNVNLTLKGVDYVDASDDGYILNMATTTAYQGNYTITIEDCNFEAAFGIGTNNGKESTLVSITNTTIKTQGVAIVAHGCKVNVTGCTITVNPGIMDGTAPAAYVAASGKGVLKISNSTMNGPVPNAFDVYPTGGEIYVTDCEWTGSTADWHFYDNATAAGKIVIDGTEYNG